MKTRRFRRFPTRPITFPDNLYALACRAQEQKSVVSTRMLQREVMLIGNHPPRQVYRKCHFHFEQRTCYGALQWFIIIRYRMCSIEQMWFQPPEAFHPKLLFEHLVLSQCYEVFRRRNSIRVTRPEYRLIEKIADQGHTITNAQLTKRDRVKAQALVEKGVLQLEPDGYSLHIPRHLLRWRASFNR